MKTKKGTIVSEEKSLGEVSKEQTDKASVVHPATKRRLKLMQYMMGRSLANTRAAWEVGLSMSPIVRPPF